MDHLLRSSSQSCSCSGREYMQAHRSHVWLPNKCKPLCAERKNYNRQLRRQSDRRCLRLCCGSQSPRQQGSGAPNGNDEESSETRAKARIISSLVTYGLSGTLAVLGAALARIDLFGQFKWLSTDDLVLGLTSSSALVALEALLLAPPYDRLLAGGNKRETGSGTSSTELGGVRKAGAVGLQLRTAQVGELLSADSVAAALVLQQACLVAAQVVRRPGLTRTSPFLEYGLVLLREASKELLQRGLMFTFLAAWLADRTFEAGADDTFVIPSLVVMTPQYDAVGFATAGVASAAATAGIEVYVTDAARYVTAVLLTASVMPLVANEAEAMRVGVASNLALIMVEQPLPAEAEAEERRRKRRQQQGKQVAEVADVEEAVTEVYDEDLDSKETEAMLREYRLYDALGRCTSTGPPRLTYALTLLRGLLRFGAPNLTFALTGNLAASFLASAVPQLLLLGYVLRGPMVLLERPAGQKQLQQQSERPGSSR
ncbi:hypothetical protein VOLCADRAFT_107464 [Volvox carteri f. nagariensis]|uniref:Uncharacterized protein n=1 Tax=Volvox carteri f. nagariensis TaxID=3068 RepID=D8UE54_VOLCA|nr:uncharacterized protein VOLCADRAFT_107464 [Volvox carteri f. nagariensis]EFJ42068.1 hypothetical protein VOLCADRAFT_107464 [Volvox carteri f. nagariensis]|eukprot:XP_002956943.1 hypothetical protein VOLCADRAFT_107464 [Volvox carteri f. nagariensis]